MERSKEYDVGSDELNRKACQQLSVDRERKGGGRGSGVLPSSSSR